MQMQTNTAPAMQTPAPPATFHRKVGNTDYMVAIYFSKTGKETLEDKILKLIRREASRNA